MNTTEFCINLSPSISTALLGSKIEKDNFRELTYPKTGPYSSLFDSEGACGVKLLPNLEKISIFKELHRKLGSHKPKML